MMIYVCIIIFNQIWNQSDALEFHHRLNDAGVLRVLESRASVQKTTDRNNDDTLLQIPSARQQ